jgi:hypothetical protein
MDDYDGVSEHGLAHPVAKVDRTKKKGRLNRQVFTFLSGAYPGLWRPSDLFPLKLTTQAYSATAIAIIRRAGYRSHWGRLVSVPTPEY